MLTGIEVIDNYTGCTLIKLAYDATNPLAPFAHCYTKLSDDSTHTVGSILRYAGHIWASLTWIATDAGERATVRYGSFIAYLYR